eukprot:1293277-Prymnesium_polylepis.1
MPLYWPGVVLCWMRDLTTSNGREAALAKSEAPLMATNMVGTDDASHPVACAVAALNSEVSASSVELSAAARSTVGPTPRQSVATPSSRATRTQTSIELR